MPMPISADGGAASFWATVVSAGLSPQPVSETQARARVIVDAQIGRRDRLPRNQQLVKFNMAAVS